MDNMKPLQNHVLHFKWMERPLFVNRRLYLLLSISPRMPDRTITVVKKHAPTPMKRELPNQAQTGNREKTIEPKASIVVREVSRIAFPVLENTVMILPLPSFCHRCMICTPSSIPMPIIRGSPIIVMKFNSIPETCIIPTIQKTPRAKGIMAISAYHGRLKSNHRRRKTFFIISRCICRLKPIQCIHRS